MKILPAAGYRRMPWKNGKGETIEIAIFPPTATVDDFDWRISMAPVVADGPFSRFEEIDRTLSILSGEGMALSVEGMAPVILGTQSEPFSFPGDQKTDAILQAGPITDLNVMTRRGRLSHHVMRMANGGSVVPRPEVDTTIVVVTQAARLRDRLLAPLDAILLSADEAGETFEIASDAPLFVISILRAR